MEGCVTEGSLVQAAVIGCGGMARHHIRMMLLQQDTTHIAAICEPSPEACAATAQIFEDAGLAPPPNEPDLGRFLRTYGAALDAVLIATPHVYHHDQTAACLKAGLDVLLEKPMVMNAAEARSLIETRDRTGRLLVVAFPGSLSPQIRTAVSMLRSGELGSLLTISATVWQGWGPGTAGRWRQQPEISGGGFLFDTGAHMLNTVADLAGEDFIEVAAWLDNYGRPVDTLSAAMGRLASGALVTLHGCGETIRTCESGVWVFCDQAILYTDVWGGWLKVKRQGRRHFRSVSVPPSLGVWEQFLAVREGRMPNPCPPEVGLRMARLWDAIRASAARGGTPVPCD
jgi:predicted dehydrogenase